MVKFRRGNRKLKSIALAFLMVFVFALPKEPIQAATNIIKYDGGYDAENYPQKSLESVFTTDEITVDGIKDVAYDQSIPSVIENFRIVDTNYGYEDESAKPYGEVRTLWDGPVMYLYVTVYDNTPYRSIAKTSSTPEEIVIGPSKSTTGNIISTSSSSKAFSKICDSISIGVDLYNDKVVYETDTIGMFTITAANDMIYYKNSSIPSLSSVMGDPNHPNYQNRVKDYSATDLFDEEGNVIGYNVEVALQLEGLCLDNGTVLGLDIGINDIDHTEDPQKPVRVGQTFWSHSQDSLYADFDHERPNSIDWGNVTLTGWNGEDEFAYSSWRLSNAIRYLDSVSFQKGVWTADTQLELDSARSAAEELLANDQFDIATTNAVADRLENAIAGLRWADTRYPDPADLPVQFTLPNTYQFFQSSRKVTNLSDWEERRAEILELAQFYEYGYKPEPADSIQIKELKVLNTGDTYDVVYDWSAFGWGIITVPTQASCPMIMGSYTLTVGDRSADMDINMYLPTDEQLAAVGRTGQKIPVVLSFDGDNENFRNAGYAVAVVPQGSSGDIRSNDYAWGTRGGAFYTLFPYSRDGAEALNEVSSEMAAAWSCSSMIDVLNSFSISEAEGAVEAYNKLDLDKLAVTGFSINGKYAFVSAVFDERIDVCIPGAAGATGPSPWRYVYTGQEYDWTDTIFAPEDLSQAKQVAFGTETLANSYRHNRVREISLFSHFLTPGHYYEMEDGAYGYGTRLPFDQHDLVATLAPRAIIVLNTVNDCNDGCLSDCLGLEIAKSVYNSLGYSADDLVKFNLRKVFTTGDPHGNDSAQFMRTGEFLNEYFYGIKMSQATASYLNTDPFSLPVSNDKTASPYDYYYGGFNTITGGLDGVNGRDGWYYYSLPKTYEDVPIIINPGQPLEEVSVDEDDTPAGDASSSAGEAVVDISLADAELNVNGGKVQNEVTLSDELIKTINENSDSVINISLDMDAERLREVLSENTDISSYDILINAQGAEDISKINYSIGEDCVKELQEAGVDTKFKLNANKKSTLTIKSAQMKKVDGSLAIECNITSEADSLTINMSNTSQENILGTLNVDVTDINAIPGSRLYVYRINKETGKYEEIPNNRKKVSQKGMIPIIADTNENYIVVTDKIEEDVVKLVDKVSVSADKTLELKGTMQIKVDLPEELSLVKKYNKSGDPYGTEEAKVTYSVNKKSVATINSNGKLKAKKAGKVTVTVTVQLENGEKKVFTKKITVK